MPTLDLSNFNIVCAVGGAFVALFGLVSYFAKEKLYLSEAFIAFGFGIIFGPAAGWIRPQEYAHNDEETLELVNRNFCRLVLGVQLVIAGIQLPPKYLKTEWKSLFYLLGPGMVLMWLFSSMLIWALVPNLSFMYALVVGACVTPTDPVLSASIVKGKFADKHLPKALQNIIIAESGANDGMGYPFLYLPLYLVHYVGKGAHGHSVGKPIGLWFYETLCYEVLLSCLYGFVVGEIAKRLLRFAEKHNWVDDEEFLIFAIAMAIFILGTDGLVGSDDLLACFVAGNVFTWDDWFRQKTHDDSLQPSIDLLLNVAIFVWFGSVCPWHSFYRNDYIPIYRLIPLGILILLFRRPPVVFALHKAIHQTEKWRQAGIVGFFGPIGVGAIFYLSVTQEYLRTEVVDEQGVERPDAVKLRETMTVVVWFLVVCSIIVHGLTISVTKLGIKVPQALKDGELGETAKDLSRVRSG